MKHKGVGTDIWIFIPATLNTGKYDIIIYSLFICCIYSPILHAQEILNGSFEQNRFNCSYNLSNSSFSSGMKNVTAFGEQSEIDVIQKSCNFGTPPDGNFFIGMYCKDNLSDALTFSLTTPFEVGKRYFLQFSSRYGLDTLGKNASITIGLSNFPDSFGMTIVVVPKINLIWQTYSFEFVAPFSAAFLSLKIASEEETWLLFDNFEIICPTIDLGTDTSYCEVKNINLVVNQSDLYEKICWNNLAISEQITINEPGFFWVEGIVGKCIVRDTISIQEIPYNCRCRLYVPNIFSPNGDSINDELSPSSPCELMDYEFTVFDRWGNLVFHSYAPTQAWDGKIQDKSLPSSTYAYFVKYRFSYQTKVQHDKGFITIF